MDSGYVWIGPRGPGRSIAERCHPSHRGWPCESVLCERSSERIDTLGPRVKINGVRSPSEQIGAAVASMSHCTVQSTRVPSGKRFAPSKLAEELGEFAGYRPWSSA